MFFLAEYANMILVSTLSRDHVLGRLALADRRVAGQLGAAGLICGCSPRRLLVVSCSSGPRHFPALPLRPDHAPGLEGLHPGDPGLAGGGRPVDADAVSTSGSETDMTRRAFAEDFLSSFLLFELWKGMALTGKYFFARKITVQYPGGEDAAVAALPRTARAAPLPERRRALHRLQAVRGGLPGARHHDRVRAARRRHPPHHALRHRPDQVHLLRLLRRELPGRLDRRDAHPRVPRREARRPVLHQGHAAGRRRPLRGRNRRAQGGRREVPLSVTVAGRRTY